MSLDAFTTEVYNRLTKLPDGDGEEHPLAQFYLICDEVRAEWKQLCPDQLATCERDINRWCVDIMLRAH